MTDETKTDESRTNAADTGPDAGPGEVELRGRRDFLLGLGRWSKAVIGAALLGGLALPGTEAEAGWVNRRGGGGGGTWVNRRGGGGGGWVNRHGGGWVNRHGGGWVNRHGGGWVNVR